MYKRQVHIVINSNLPSLRFYLKVCIIYAIGFLGVGMKFWEMFMYNEQFLLFYLIILSIIWIIINKFTILQLLFVWIPESINLFFKNTCCKPKLRFNYRDIYKKGDKFILKGNIY